MKPTTMQQEVLWPSLPYSAWHDTLDTLHMWLEIVGKVKLALCPFLNQWWEVAFTPSARGLTTGRIPYQQFAFEMMFDFLSHTLRVQTSTGKEEVIQLRPCSVADFYTECMDLLQRLGIEVAIHAVPSEVPEPIPFAKDTQHASYDKMYVARWWQIVLQSSLVFDTFRSSFRGKSSPIQFFWGSCDVNGTRFSGKVVTPPNAQGEMKHIMRFAENEENFAFGFWAGDARFPNPAYYTYMYPQPQGFTEIDFTPGASFNEQLSECIYPYEQLRKSGDVANNLLSFLTTTYTASAKLAGWDIQALQGITPDKL